MKFFTCYIYFRINLASSYPSVVVDLLRDLREYKDTMKDSIRRKKTNLEPYLRDFVPTPLEITDPRNQEHLFVVTRWTRDVIHNIAIILVQDKEPSATRSILRVIENKLPLLRNKVVHWSDEETLNFLMTLGPSQDINHNCWRVVVLMIYLSFKLLTCYDNVDG